MVKLDIEKNKEINTKKVNEVIHLSSKILKLFYILMVIGVIFLITLVAKEWNVLWFASSLLKVISPVFIGFIIAWLFNPLVTWLKEKGINRVLSSIVIYLILLVLIYLILITLVPTINTQLNDLFIIVPDMFNKFKGFITNMFASLNNIEGFDLTSVQNNIFETIQSYAINFVTELPNNLIKILTSFFSGIGIFIISLFIGFYMLLNFNSISKHFITIFPNKYRYEIETLLTKISVQLYNFVKGTLLVASFIFVACSIAFAIIGLKAPILFGLFCGITNIIPYVGPYIGGIPAVLAGFSQGSLVGVLVGVSIFVVQMIEGNFLTPIVMSKKMNLHPVVIMVGLMTFGYFFGIAGLIFATPTIALMKILICFFVTKFDLFADSSFFEHEPKVVVVGRKKKSE